MRSLTVLAVIIAGGCASGPNYCGGGFYGPRKVYRNGYRCAAGQPKPDQEEEPTVYVADCNECS